MIWCGILIGLIAGDSIVGALAWAYIVAIVKQLEGK